MAGRMNSWHVSTPRAWLRHAAPVIVALLLLAAVVATFLFVPVAESAGAAATAAPPAYDAAVDVVAGGWRAMGL